MVHFAQKTWFTCSIGAMQDVPKWKVGLAIIVLFGLFYPLMSWQADERIAQMQVPEEAVVQKEAVEPTGIISPKEKKTVPELPAKDLQIKPKEDRKIPTAPLLFPVEGMTQEAIISFYGDPRNGGKRLHEGVDIKADRGTPVIATQDGIIHRVKEGGGGGKQVWLKTDDGWQFFYAHLDSWVVEEEQLVKAGDILGTVGNTGNASHTIPHLHFGIYVDRRKTIDPLPYLEKTNVYP